MNRTSKVKPGDFDAAAKAVYLEKLTETGLRVHSARAAGVTSSTVRHHRLADADFAAREEEAEAHHTETCLQELHRRAVQGYDKPVFWQGAQAGVVREYSDALLLAKVRARAGEYRQGDKLTIDQTTKHSGHIVHADLEALDDTQRALLRKLIESSLPKPDAADGTKS